MVVAAKICSVVAAKNLPAMHTSSIRIYLIIRTNAALFYKKGRDFILQCEINLSDVVYSIQKRLFDLSLHALHNSHRAFKPSSE